MNDVAIDPGMGKSKLIRKWVKKFNKRRKKQGLPKLKITKLKAAKLKPSDLTGYLTPGSNS